MWSLSRVSPAAGHRPESAIPLEKIQEYVEAFASIFYQHRGFKYFVTEQLISSFFQTPHSPHCQIQGGKGIVLREAVSKRQNMAWGRKHVSRYLLLYLPQLLASVNKILIQTVYISDRSLIHVIFVIRSKHVYVQLGPMFLSSSCSCGYSAPCLCCVAAATSVLPLPAVSVPRLRSRAMIDTIESLPLQKESLNLAPPLDLSGTISLPLSVILATRCNLNLRPNVREEPFPSSNSESCT